MAKANTLEGGVDEDIITTANSGGASGDAFNSVTGSGVVKFDSAFAAKGSLSGRFNLNGQSTIFLTWTGLGTLTDHYSRLYFRTNGFPASGSTRIWEFRDASALCLGLRFNASSQIEVIDRGGVVRATSSAFSTATWYRVEMHLVHGPTTTGDFEIRTYAGDDTSPTETLTHSDSQLGDSADRSRMGFSSGTGMGANIMWLDALVAGATDWPGPATVAAAGSYHGLLLRGIG